MYLHAGNHKNIRASHIIGVFDTDNATVCDASRKFLSNAQKKGILFAAKEEIPKSFILYREKNQMKVCFSQISSTALIGRTKNDG
ncbi:MAG: DUF370 domain-containing protein [Clostridia bacterium]|nr:DUF370 domain-containing protein [Clostridia bacterium]